MNKNYTPFKHRRSTFLHYSYITTPTRHFLQGRWIVTKKIFQIFQTKKKIHWNIPPRKGNNIHSKPLNKNPPPFFIIPTNTRNTQKRYTKVVKILRRERKILFRSQRKAGTSILDNPTEIPLIVKHESIYFEASLIALKMPSLQRPLKI